MLQSGVAWLVGIVANAAPTICLICASGSNWAASSYNNSPYAPNHDSLSDSEGSLRQS